MFKLIELLRVEEELIVLMVESVHICHLNVMFKCGQLKKLQPLKKKERVVKLQKEKSQLVKNDQKKYLNISTIITI